MSDGVTCLRCGGELDPAEFRFRVSGTDCSDVCDICEDYKIGATEMARAIAVSTDCRERIANSIDVGLQAVGP